MIEILAKGHTAQQLCLLDAPAALGAHAVWRQRVDNVLKGAGSQRMHVLDRIHRILLAAGPICKTHAPIAALLFLAPGSEGIFQ